MKRSRFSETEIVYAVKRVEAGVPLAELSLDKHMLQDSPAKKA